MSAAIQRAAAETLFDPDQRRLLFKAGLHPVLDIALA